MPYGFCKCGCGGKTRLHTRTQKSKGIKLGEPRDYLPAHSLIKLGDTWDVCRDTNCWNWTASVMKNGYGVGRRPEGGRGLAHRIIYERFKGPIPDGLDLDHLCRNRRCVNPDHLEAVTHRENVLRGEAISAQSARSSHCTRGHVFTKKLRWSAAKGWTRFCWTCLADWKLERKQKRNIQSGRLQQA